MNEKRIDVKLITDPRDLEVVNRFAATFDHAPVANLYWPLYLVTSKEDEKPIAYFQVASGPIIFPAISPACGPRELLEGVRAIVARLHEQSKTVYAVASHDNFDDRTMKHLGFEREINGSRLYSSHNST